MGATGAIHPTDQTLKAYGLGKLDDASASSVTSHLDSCADCQRKVADASSDSFVGRLRKAEDAPASTAAVGSSLVGLSMMDSDADPAERPATSSLPPGLADHPDYEVLRELGQGGMGTVYLARNRLMDRLDVLKVVSSHLISRKGVLERFQTEIKNAAKLHHPNIVTAYTATRIGDTIMLAMEYVNGHDLSKVVKKSGPLTIPHACYFVRQAALGLQHAHELGMVHRDIKPSNLMYARHGNQATIKVLDFGLAKIKSESERMVDAGLTYEGQTLGTPHYMSPEQWIDARKADIRADIYSLGCTLYYLLTGAPPFDSNSIYELLQAHQSMDALPLNLARPEVPVELAAIVGTMMAKEPERRFQEPKEVAQALLPLFKKSSATTARVASQVSHASQAAPPPATPANGTMPITPAISATSTAAAGRQNPRSEPQWESLIAMKEDEPVNEAAAPSPSGRRPRPFRVAAIAASVMGLLAVCGVIIYVATDYGRLKIELNDPKAVVKVDGQVVTVESDGAPITLRANKHMLDVTWGDGQIRTTEPFEIMRGGETRLVVKQEPKPVPKTVDRVPDPRPADPPKEQPTTVVVANSPQEVQPPEDTPEMPEPADDHLQPPVTEPTKPAERVGIEADREFQPLRRRNFVGWNGLHGNEVVDPATIFRFDGDELIWAGTRGRIFLNRPFTDFSFKFEYRLPADGRHGTAFSRLRLGDGNSYEIGDISHRVGEVGLALTNGSLGRIGDIMVSPYVFDGNTDYAVLKRTTDASVQYDKWIDAEIRCDGREIKFFLGGRLVNQVVGNLPITAHPGFNSFDTDIRFRNVRIISKSTHDAQSVATNSPQPGTGKKPPTKKKQKTTAPDLLQPGSEWRGHGRLGRPITLIILSRDGERFKAHWADPILVCRLEGTYVNGTISWHGRDYIIEKGDGLFDIAVSGAIRGEEMFVRWEGVHRPDGKDISGELTLRLQNP